MEGEPNSPAARSEQPIPPLFTAREKTYWDYLSEADQPKDKSPKREGRRVALRRTLSMRNFDNSSLGDIESPLYGS